MVGRTLFRLLAFLAVAYAAIAGLFYVYQRDFLYTPKDPANLAAPETLAIPGSERVAISTPDGQKLAGWYVAPKPGKPVFLFIHGRGGSLERMKGRWRRIKDAGYGVFAFSLRGYPGSTGTPSEEGFRTDARAAFDWLKEKHAEKDIIIHGLSLGSGVAARLATEVEARALILEAPYTAAVDLAGELYPWLPVSVLLADRFETRSLIDKVKMPVMIAHGDRDSVIPFRHGEELFALAKEPKVFVRMPGGDHVTLVRDGLYDHIWPFVENSAKP